MKQKFVSFVSVIFLMSPILIVCSEVFANTQDTEQGQVQEKQISNDVGTLESEGGIEETENIKTTQTSKSNSGEIIEDNSFEGDNKNNGLYANHPPIQESFKTYAEFLSCAPNINDFMNTALNPDSIGNLRTRVLTEMSKKISGSVPLPDTVGESVDFKWSNIAVDTKSGSIVQRYKSGNYNIQDLRESYLYAFGSKGYSISEEAYNEDRSIKLILRTSSSDPLGVDLSFVVLKKQKEYSTKFTFQTPKSFFHIVFFQRVYGIYNVRNYDGKFLLEGKPISVDFSPFIKPSVDNLTAEPVSQTTTLGRDSSELDYSKFVTNVKLNDQLLSSDQYEVSLVDNFPTDTVGDKTAKVLVTYKKDSSTTLSLDVPVKVLWGNSIAYGGYDYGGDGRTTAAFTLNNGDSPSITAVQGKNNDNLAIHSSYSNKQYYTFNWFNLSNKQSLKIDESNNGDKYIKASGNDLKRDKLKEWGNNQKQEVHYGDVVRAWQVETGKNWLYENEQRNSYNEGKQSVYYEITKEGYRPLHFNQLETKNVMIPIYSTKEYLDKNMKDYIDLKGYSNISVKEISQYPNTKDSGQQKGKIIVEETLTTGKKVQYEYEITFIIGEGELTYSVPKTLTFKEFTKSKSEQVIQRMYSGDLGLKISDNRGEGKQGNWRLTAQVNQSEELSPYLIFRVLGYDGTPQDKYLNQGATEIYSQAKQSNPTEPLNVEVSGQWTKDTGILLKVPPKNNLSSKQYTSTITWNLVEGP
ncbi:hypothetical protein K9D10_001729 [Enterococcus faecalis]|nr:hypothetical protein [Enterococcus faecalis]